MYRDPVAIQYPLYPVYSSVFLTTLNSSKDGSLVLKHKSRLDLQCFLICKTSPATHGAISHTVEAVCARLGCWRYYATIAARVWQGISEYLFSTARLFRLLGSVHS